MKETRRMRSVRGLGVMLGVLVGGAVCRPAAARSCADLGLQFEARVSDAIFEGEVVEGPERTVFSGEEGEKVMADRYEIEVDRYYLGHLGTRLSLYIPNEWHEFGMPRLGTGGRGVFFASWWRGRLATNECSGTFRPYGDIAVLGPGAEPVPLDGPWLNRCAMAPGLARSTAGWPSPPRGPSGNWIGAGLVALGLVWRRRGAAAG